MKTCKQCSETKSVSEFWKNASAKDGLQFYCKTCLTERYAERRDKRGGLPIEEYKKLRLEKATSPTRKCIMCKKTKKRTAFHKNRWTPSGYSNICRKCRPIYEAGQWNKLKSDPERYAEYRKKHNKRMLKHLKTPKGKKQSACRKIVQHALKAGIITRQPCEECGATKKIQAHHDDYDKPLDITWLCHKCHKAVHRY